MVQFLENHINRRRERHARQRSKRGIRHQTVEWLKAFLWAAMVVLLINQYFLQAYRIPSGSMQDTLLIGDRLFVGKFVYGPEILPSVGKINFRRKPVTGEIIIFENPSYIQRGVMYSVLQRVVYMVSLSLIDLDRDVAGNQRAQLLIKRLVSSEGDVVRLSEGEFYFRSYASSADPAVWLTENSYTERADIAYDRRRLITESHYELSTIGSRLFALQEMGVTLSDEEERILRTFVSQDTIDGFHFEYTRNRTLLSLHPLETHRLYRYQRAATGWYIPHGYFLPLGDNRDNSRDGRYFGILPKSSVLGKAQLIYWPPRRFTLIR